MNGISRDPGTTDRLIAPAAFVLGFTSLVTQTVLLREFLSVFCGNELVMGIVLANWMLLTGAGAVLGRVAVRLRHPVKLLLAAFAIGGVFPLAAAFLLSYLRTVVFPPGSVIGIMESMYFSFLLLLPFCVTGGFLFALIAHVALPDARADIVPTIYSLEAAGSVVGGLLCHLILIYVLTALQILVVVALVNEVIALLLTIRSGMRFFKILIIGGGTVLLVLTASLNLDRLARERLFPGQKVLAFKDTPYGKLTVTRLGDQVNFYENSALLFSTNDPASSEEAVHYAMVQHREPRRILLVSGGISGTTDEILKYRIERLDYVEIDPGLVDLGRQYGRTSSDDRVHVINEDARRFVRATVERYDVALIDLPDPTTAQINRCYTLEFLCELKARLTPDGVISLSLLSSTEYMGDEARHLSSSVYNTLRAVFRHVVIVPGGRNYYLASDAELTVRIGEMVSLRAIENAYVNRFYFEDDLQVARSRELAGALDTTAALNTDFRPVAYYGHLRYWLGYFKVDPWVPAVVGVVLMILVVVRLNAISFGMFVGGFAAASMEVVLLVAFQILYGYVYQVTGLIITVFMGGLAAGALLGRLRFDKRGIHSLIPVQVAVGLYCLVLPAVISFVASINAGDALTRGIFLVLSFIIAAFTGLLFAISASLLRGKAGAVASEIYSVDLLGSGIGAFVVTVYLVPLLGISAASVVTAGVGFAGPVVSLLSRKHHTG